MKGYKNSTKTIYETESSANYAEGGKVKASKAKAVSDADHEVGRHMRLEYGPKWREKKVEPADYIGASKKARAFSDAMDPSYPEDKASMRAASEILKERGVAEGDKVYQRLKKMYATRGYAEGGKVKAPKAKPYDPVKDEPTSRPLTADQVRNIRNQMKAPKPPAKRAYDPVRDEPTSRAFKKGGHVKKQAGGLLAEREMAARDMVGKAKGGAASAVHKHERNMHPGKPLTKMRNGGKVGC
jgi:hypothetical protein